MLEYLMNSLPENLLILSEIGIMLIVASIFAFFLRMIKQPLIPAYIIAGVLVGPLVLGIVESQGLILSLSEIGVAFLIFSAGIEINLKKRILEERRPTIMEWFYLTPKLD